MTEFWTLLVDTAMSGSATRHFTLGAAKKEAARISSIQHRTVFIMRTTLACKPLPSVEWETEFQPKDTEE